MVGYNFIVEKMLFMKLECLISLFYVVFLEGIDIVLDIFSIKNF